VRGAEAGERRHEINPRVVRHARGERLDVADWPDDAESVAQPLDHGAADEHSCLPARTRAARRD